MKIENVNILDCTFRDGGYYNNWDFHPVTIEKYLKAMSDLKVNFVEIGFRFTPKNKFLGALAYSTDEFLNTLEVPSDVSLGVMVNSGDLISLNVSAKDAVKTLFSDAKDSTVKLVRFASHFHQVEETVKYAGILKEMGYIVGLNIMQASFFSSEELEEKARFIGESKNVDVLYFADSMGNMLPPDIETMYQTFRSGCGKDLPIGIHTHNNMGQALDNTIKGIEVGVTWVDSTVQGMGRGAGNTPTEDLFIHLIEKEQSSLSHDELGTLMELISDHFEPMRSGFKWGPSYLYRLAAMNEVHPTYIQQMLMDDRYSSNDIIKVVKGLERDEARFYSLDKMQSKLYKGNSTPSSWSASSLGGKKVALILASGPSMKRYAKAIENFIEKNSVAVIATNFNDHISPKLIDAYCACHPTRMISDANDYKNHKCSIIAPTSSFTSGEKKVAKELDVVDYALNVQPYTLDISDKGCVLPSPSVFSYALSLLTAAGYEKILIAGLDGYIDNYNKNTLIRQELNLFDKLYDKVELVAVTPTIHDLKQSSIYSPQI